MNCINNHSEHALRTQLSDRTYKQIIIDKKRPVVNKVSVLGVIYGNTLSWSSPVEKKLSVPSEDNPFKDPVHKEDLAWIASLLTLGACAGAWFFALIIDVCGRRWGLIILALPMIVSYLLMITIKKVEIFIAGRFFMGLTEGGIMIVTSAYQSEVPPKEIRGIVFAWYGIMMSCGTLISYCIGPFISVTAFNIILIGFPIIAFATAIVFCEESPYYCLMKKDVNKAKICLTAFRQLDANVDEELKEIEDKIKEQYEGKLFDIFKTKAFWKSFVMGNLLLLFQQLTGIFVILMYSEKIFLISGSKLDPSISAIILGLLFLLSAVVSPFVVENFNRRTLLTVSALSMAFFEIILGIFCILDEAKYNVQAFRIIPIGSLGLFIFCFNFGNGPLTWVVSAELFPTRAKALCLAFSVFGYFFIGFMLTTHFQGVVDLVGLGTVCLIFAGFCLCSVLFYIIFLIETRGKTLGEIQDELKS